jgi:hypothetical protein
MINKHNLIDLSKEEEDISKLINEYLAGYVNTRITEDIRRLTVAIVPCTEERDNVLILKPFVQPIWIISLWECSHGKISAVDKYFLMRIFMSNDVENRDRYFPLPELRDLSGRLLTDTEVAAKIQYEQESKDRLSKKYSEHLSIARTLLELFFTVMLLDSRLEEEFNGIFCGITNVNGRIRSANDLYRRLPTNKLGSNTQKFVINILKDKLGISFNCASDTIYKADATHIRFIR